jgi:DNA polymerase elongation subunit (family B)
MVVYGDTDSNYVTFQEVVASCDWKGDDKDLILKINEYRLSGYLKKCFDIYSEKWGTDNYQDFELETLSINGIFLGKKKYVTNIVYSDGVHSEPLSAIKTTGVEMIKGGTPPFVREKLLFLTKFIFSKGRSFNLREFVTELKTIKKDFKAQQPENISAGIAVNNMEKFILNDSTALEVAKACPIHVRASGYHNYLLNNSKYKDKYPLLRSGDKVRFYFVKTKSSMDNNVFAFAQGAYPYEFAPQIDYDEQFTKTILDPINRFIEVMGHNPISPNLFMINTLF